MMRDTITRTLCTSTVHGCRLTMKDGSPVVEELEPLTVNGKASKKEAEKALRKAYGKDAALTVVSIDVEEALYEITVADFLAHAKKVEKSADTNN